MSNYIKRSDLINMINKMPCVVVSEYNLHWKDKFEELVQCIGSASYGKERWFHEYDEKGGRARWYDRAFYDYIDTDELIHRIVKVINDYERE